MDRVLTDFIRALRSGGVEVSPAETIDAAGALKIIGYGDRTALKNSLSCALAKTEAEKIIHDDLFELYFSRKPSASASEDGGQSDGEQSESASEIEHLSQSGDEAAIAMALEQAAQEAGVQDIRFSTQTAYYAQQMMKAMGSEKLQERLIDALQNRDPDAEDIMQARADIQARAREYVEQQFDVFGKGATEQFREEILGSKRLSELDSYDLHRMKQLIAKIAKKLASKHSRRRKRKNRGVLDVRKTLRANAGVDGVPFSTIWKQKKKDRPKIIAMCDVSGSVSQYVRFLLLLLYGLKETIPKLDAYAFSGRLEDVGPLLTQGDFDPAMKRIVNTIGMSSTDYGQSLSDFKVKHWNTLDRRTTIIMLGDGRSNHGDPRLDIFKEMAARAKRVIWLCPEPPSLWGTGDSEMLRYKPWCNQMSHVATLKDLERAVDEVLAGYA